jgi:lincosamide nucleotidyltransferase B/F
VLRQEEIIASVRSVCASTPSLDAALMYGSFAQGVGDAYSDVEFWLFFSGSVVSGPVLSEPGMSGPVSSDPVLGPVEPLEWLALIAPYEHVVVNEFGAHVVFYPGLIRGEFHFASAADIGSVASWPARSAAVANMVICDRTGALTAALSSLPTAVAVPSSASEVAELCGRFANWLVLAHHVRMRGEALRAHDALSHARRHLLWMARLSTGRVDTWLTPSRRAETDLPPAVVTAVGSSDLGELWECGRSLWTELSSRFDFPVPVALFASIDEALLSR